MNRIPPALSYLTVYNQTLRPGQPVDNNDEDAEEQAHILFYTSRERAVSRDRMLRQIGLAKALINFSQSFGAEQPYNTVHSQTRRMLMISPEPDFWIHACVELAKVERIPDLKAKAKSKSKPPPDKGKVKELAPIYDHEYSSVIDGALKTHILKGFEKFKLTHGSMSSILGSLGQQALELQLERFWTVWAWSWDIETQPDFAEDYGIQLHPHFAHLISILDDFSTDLSDLASPIILSRSNIIPSTRYTERRYPSSLVTHLSSMIPPRVVPSNSSDTVNTLAASVDTIRGRHVTDHASSGTSSRAKSPEGKFLGIPTNVDFNMDPTKWQWPGYLTFGKKNTPKPPIPRQTVTPPVEDFEDKTVGKATDSSDNADTGQIDARAEESTVSSAPTPIKRLEVTQVEAEVNAEDLQDAIQSDSMSMGSKGAESLKHEPSGIINQYIASSSQSASTPSEEERSLPSTPPLPEFSMTKVHLAPFDDPTATRRVSIHYLVMSDLMFALPITQTLCDEGQDLENTDLQYAIENVVSLLSEIESVAREQSLKSISESLPSANKILQPQDRYLMSTSQYTLGSPNFSSKSGHLFSAKAILDTDPGISEVFSRGQNPQHWHVARRGLGGVNASLGLTGNDDEVFMEVHRKETSLTDVDNVLTGVVKKSGLVEPAGLRSLVMVPL
ncbi:hypothetical protein CPB83DRAFT_851016 [Crepidotus variabilis]|uniref:CCZ1/INTU/HSP4 first Longin domain-containing protein n=1 Tax=Crepidotus variabilis TaxID=179855 RepID=A0A9P6EKA8_9AGAR|nr:hypothetical protein CPB83DRAFT_851016 [Crepidotus variabilis]